MGDVGGLAESASVGLDFFLPEEQLLYEVLIGDLSVLLSVVSKKRAYVLFEQIGTSGSTTTPHLAMALKKSTCPSRPF